MKKKRGKQRSTSLLAPLTDEEFAALMRDVPPPVASESVTLTRCDWCAAWVSRRIDGAHDTLGCLAAACRQRLVAPIKRQPVDDI